MDDKQKKAHKNIPETDRWILCDSKSNPGRKYYYNPLTKQTLWHHSDEEIKKEEERKKRTISIADNPSNNTNVDKQFDMPKNYDAASTCEPKITNSIPPPINAWGLPFIQPTVPFIQQSVPTAFINSPLLCNQIITPNQTVVDLPCSTQNTINQVQNINTFSPNFDFNSYELSNLVLKLKENKSENAMNRSADLRNKILCKDFKNRHTHNQLAKHRTTHQKVNRNVTWDDERVKVILSYLRNYAPPGTKSDCWYIVPDTAVVLKHSRLLYQMTALDGKRCRLKVPQSVRMELGHLEQKFANKAISRFLRFHCMEIDSDIELNNKKDRINNLINTCRKLSEANYHVVLLCYTDKSFLSFKRRLNTPVFTVNKIIELQSQGRLIPRNSTIPSEAVTDQAFSDDTNIDNKRVCEESPTIETRTSLKFNASPTKDLDLKIDKEVKCNAVSSNVSTKSDGVTKYQYLEKAITRVVEQNFCSSKPDTTCTHINIKHNSNKSTKKRIIKLKPACEENAVSGHSSKKKRWSAFKNLTHESQSTTLQSTPHNEVNDSMLEQKIDDKDNSMIQSSKELNNSKPNDLIPTEVEKPSTSNIESAQIKYNNNNKNKSTSTTKPVSSLFPDRTSKTIDSDFEDFTKVNTWIPKFMDIMENVLMGVLSQDSTVDVKEIPQLLRLHKATLDIIKNFSNRWLIVDAANKLSMKISQATDSKGTIKLDQNFFDDIFVYGVNFVKVLEEISSNLADIKNAQRMLENIRDDNLTLSDSSCYNVSTNIVPDQQEVFRDYNKKYEEENKVTIDTTKPSTDCTTGQSNSDTKNDNEDNCLSNKRKFDEINDAHENVYFNALKLRKRHHEQEVNISDPLDISENNDEEVTSNEYKDEKYSLLDMQEKEYFLKDTTDGISDPTEIKNDAVIITSYSDMLEDNLISVKEGDKNIEYSEQAQVFQQVPDENSSNLDNEKFKCFIGMFLKEIREALIVCAQNFEMCISHHNVINNDLSEKFEEVHAHLYNIQRSLDSIIHRETGDVNNNFQSLLRQAGVDVKLDQSLCDEYRGVVHKCRSEVNEFLKVLERKFSAQNWDLPLPSPQYV